MIDGSEKCNCWWQFEFQILHVFERHSNYLVFKATVCKM